LIPGENYTPKFCNFICTAKAVKEGEVYSSGFLSSALRQLKLRRNIIKVQQHPKRYLVLAFHFNNPLATLNLAAIKLNMHA
jgi:hypothetical protein